MFIKTKLHRKKKKAEYRNAECRMQNSEWENLNFCIAFRGLTTVTKNQDISLPILTFLPILKIYVEILVTKKIIAINIL